MDRLNLTLPETLKQQVQQRAATGGCGSASEYLRDLIRLDQRQQKQQELEIELLPGLASGPTAPMTADDWQALRRGVQTRARSRQSKSP